MKDEESINVIFNKKEKNPDPIPLFFDTLNLPKEPTKLQSGLSDEIKSFLSNLITTKEGWRVTASPSVNLLSQPHVTQPLNVPSSLTDVN